MNKFKHTEYFDYDVQGARSNNCILIDAKNWLANMSNDIVGINSSDGNYVSNSMPCAMCKRVIINSGIKKIIIRDTKTKYREITVDEFIDNDDSLSGVFCY